MIATCRLCGRMAEKLFSGVVLESCSIDYFECKSCGYVQTEQPIWLDQAYSQAINDSDTGIMIRNQANARIVLATLSLLGKVNGRVVDYAGGYGILVRMLRDIGVEALWSDPYCENLLCRGFEYREGRADLVTAFEAFEHFVDPGAELDQMLEIAPNLLLSTEIIANPAPQPDAWWYYGKDHGQHVGFFRVRTLHELAARHGKYLLTDGKAYHLFSERPVSAVRWGFLRTLAQLSPKALSLRLSPKTASDHMLLKKYGPLRAGSRFD